MKKIKYSFCDGTTQEVEVNEEVFSVYQEMETQERHSNKRETRRHISLNHLNDLGVDFEDSNADPLSALVREAEKTEFANLLASVLNPKQIWLFNKHFVEGFTETEIAQQENVSISAICQRLKTIEKKLKLFFQKP